MPHTGQHRRLPNGCPSKDEQSDQPPDGGYGWVCTVAAAVVNAHCWGFNSAYAIFLAYYMDHQTFQGATHLHYALVGSLSLTETFMISPIATVATQRYGIQKTMFAGVIFETASLICASLATQIWHLFLTQGVLFASVIPQWFTSKRSLASGVSLSGAGLGGLVYSLATEAMIDRFGLTWAFRILGILAFTVITTCILLIRDRSRTAKCSKAMMELALTKNGGFVLLVGFSCFTIFGYFILIFNLASYGDEIGLTPSQASLISGLFNLGQAVGRPCIGYFSDSVGRVNIAGIATFLAGLICLAVWANANSYGLLVFFAISKDLWQEISGQRLRRW
ncbi:predicted protein [Aspergillus terreus NIH2624]|uniref:Major facilitator superfamily (MFS) profile domain-containing protein n=1 Tax=Aspergillus terreus (strain NIH 2624 / FGSC A1156) TaxID=341663 RepID=Q0CJB2_ASPTN|nr:uncharacterized protein ATEG_06222 [Aspergillus terreus NIH2624]EAU33983.1 predicted protein [Aspergillus terreus NIH2624]